MRAVDVIRKKRDGHELTDEEIRFICEGAARETDPLPDYQLTAFLMATYLRGMTDSETARLTLAMADSGEQLDLSCIEGAKVDKHSTGGVGDTTTLILAPLAAACGARVAKMSGRGLGHTGGTLDKLESIPGLSTSLSKDAFIEQVRRIGLAVISQTGRLVPTDGKFYALRDVTATVDSIPLIASSVMSKKIAAGCDTILLDVKIGKGAFMKTLDDARLLGRSMVNIGRQLKRNVAAVISDMDAPLGAYIGNALEVKEAIEILRGEHLDGPLATVSLTLCGHLLALAGLAPDPEGGRAQAEKALRSGTGLAKLRAMIEAQGGDGLVTEDVGRLPQARAIEVLAASQVGYLGSMDAEGVGEAAMLLGAGRAYKTEQIDPAVGIVLRARPGTRLAKGEPIAEFHYNDDARLRASRQRLEQAMRIVDEPPAQVPLIREIIR
jgi:pyrimidine-nucleoside phosphorylase